MTTKNRLPEVVTPDDLLMTNSPFTAEQLSIFYQKTPEDKLMKRPAKGGGTWDYVKTGYAIDVLNRVFGYLWSFEVLTSLEEAAKMAGSGVVVVKGRLTVYANGIQLVKEQFGRCEVKFKTKYDEKLKKRVPTKEFLDFGNDMKGAASDALKKCASEFGLFRDVYHKDDFQEMDVISIDEKQQREDEAIEKAKEDMRKAENMAELQKVFIHLPIEVRGNHSVIASKDTLKRKFLKKNKKGESDESSKDQTK